jgi:hypothetical protein
MQQLTNTNMNIKVKVINHKNGEKTVQLPLTDWELINKKLATLQQKEKVRKSLTSALKEVDEIKKGKRKGRRIETLLQELKNN